MPFEFKINADLTLELYGMKRTESCFSSLELFAGAGGLALGVHDAGFKLLGLYEWNEFAVDTLRDNSSRVLDLDPKLIALGDVCDPEIDFTRHQGKVHLLAGGPPCQPFSTAGLNRGHNDSRNLFPVFVDVIGAIRPLAVLVENVKGLLRPRFREYVQYILKRIEFPLARPHEREDWPDHYARLKSIRKNEFKKDEQYEVDFQLVDAADYGVPQRRERVIFTAFRRDTNLSPIVLKPTHSRAALLFDQWVTRGYWKRHGIRPREDHLLESDHMRVQRLCNDFLGKKYSLNKPWVTVRDAISDLEEPVLRGDKPRIPNHVQHPGARIYKCHIGSYWDFPAKALKAGTNGTPGGENILRYSKKEFDASVRYFTTREAARLQTFPDTWIFHGSWGACIKQLGNAVPVTLARLYAFEIYNKLCDLHYNRVEGREHYVRNKAIG